MLRPVVPECVTLCDDFDSVTVSAKEEVEANAADPLTARVDPRVAAPVSADVPATDSEEPTVAAPVSAEVPVTAREAEATPPATVRRSLANSRRLVSAATPM